MILGACFTLRGHGTHIRIYAPINVNPVGVGGGGGVRATGGDLTNFKIF